MVCINKVSLGEQHIIQTKIIKHVSLRKHFILTEKKENPSV